MLVRKVRCRACGAPKVSAPRTAYVYCDYCGALMDWDFQVACDTGEAPKPGPRYEALLVMLHPKLAAARFAKDTAALREAHRRLLDQHMTDCPASYSPRIGDPVYRAALLDYQVAYVAEAELAPETKAAQDEVDTWSRRLAWEPGPGGTRRVRADTFWKLCVAFEQSIATNEKLLEGRDWAAGHPDQPTEDLLRRMGMSIFVQAWLPVLDESTAAQLLLRERLRTEYEPVPDVPVEDRRCAGCGGALHVPKGARRSVCEGCGHVADVETPIFCPHCGGPLAFPAGRTLAACPYCSAEVRLV